MLVGSLTPVRGVEMRVQVAGLVDRIDRRRWWVAAVLVVVGLLAAWTLALWSGSLTAVSRHWFYVPVVFAAVRFGVPGGLLAGVLAGLLAGPAVFTVDGSAGAYEVWGVRGAFFVGVGVFVGGLVSLVRASQRRELQLAEQEKRLTSQRAALIQTVSHEFRTPLTVLHGGIQTLERRQDEVSERLRPLIASLARAESRLEEMVTVVLATADAMDVSQRLSAEPVRLTALVQSVVASLDHAGGTRRVAFEIDVDAEVLVTVPGYLQLALRCVVDNALRFSPADRPVTVSATRSAGSVRIGVRDHGEGIDPDFLDEAFQPFTQGDASSRRRHGGLGMGLFTARRIIDRLDGTISIRTAREPGQAGTTVEIVLPQRREADRARRARERSTGRVWASGRRQRRAPRTSPIQPDTVG